MRKLPKKLYAETTQCPKCTQSLSTSSQPCNTITKKNLQNLEWATSHSSVTTSVATVAIYTATSSHLPALKESPPISNTVFQLAESRSQAKFQLKAKLAATTAGHGTSTAKADGSLSMHPTDADGLIQDLPTSQKPLAPHLSSNVLPSL